MQPSLPEIGVLFDVSVTQVENPDTIFIQRYPATSEEGPFAKDEDETLDIAKDQIDELGRISVLMNSPGFFDDNSVLDVIQKGK